MTTSIRAAIRIFADNNTESELSRILQLDSTKNPLVKLKYWILAGEFEPTFDLDDVAVKFLDQYSLWEKAQLFADAGFRAGNRAQFMFSIYMFDEPPSVCLSRRIIKYLYQANLDLDVDIAMRDAHICPITPAMK